MPKRGIATAQTPEHIEILLLGKLPHIRSFLNKN